MSIPPRGHISNQLQKHLVNRQGKALRQIGIVSEVDLI